MPYVLTVVRLFFLVRSTEKKGAPPKWAATAVIGAQELSSFKLSMTPIEQKNVALFHSIIYNVHDDSKTQSWRRPIIGFMWQNYP